MPSDDPFVRNHRSRGLALRVGIDGRAFASPAAGVRRYVGSLVPALLALGEPLEMVALGGQPELLPPGVAHEAEPLHPPTNLGWTLVGLPRAARRAGVDVIHAPAYTAPWVAPAPVVVSIHDVSYARHPEWYPYRRDPVRRMFYRRSALSAAHVITMSQFSADEITAAYGIPTEHITVTPLAADPRFSPAAGDPSPAPRGVTPPYVLHVGDLHERRNLAVVIDAVGAARRGGGPTASLSLVLVGSDRGVGGALRSRAAAAGVTEAVVYLASVSEDELVNLYRGAEALVYPSVYEGFGLPLIEAMAAGTPVLASRAACIPEVTGDAARLLDPSNTAEWTTAISEVVGNAAQRAQMGKAGVVRAAAFTWERAARLTWDVYRSVA